MTRRTELLHQATDYVRAHGLIGLSLRPLAAALGTSDRMLLYHFGNRDALVSAVIEESITRSTAQIAALPAAAGPAEAVRILWRAQQQPELGSCLNLYLQAASTGLLGQEPYLSATRAANERWRTALVEWFSRSGAAADQVDRIVNLVDVALAGLQIDAAVEDSADLDRTVEDLATLVGSLG